MRFLFVILSFSLVSASFGVMAQSFPSLSEEQLLQHLHPPEGKVSAVLNTDTYNEIDDQFAVVYALLSPEQIDLQAIGLHNQSGVVQH